jgi:GT2 family glycosyltransferase
MSAPPTVSIIIVNWNTADLLVACLASIARSSVSREVIVVDNASRDESRDRVRSSFPDVKLIALDSNAGFTGANNVALDVATGRFLVLLNPDTELRPGAIEALVSFFEQHPRAGIAGPPLWNTDGSRQSSVQPFPSLGSEFLRQTMLHRVFSGFERREARRHDSRPVPVVTGAALCIRRECFEAIGPLDPDFFMFYEDTDWCRRAHVRGWEVWYADGPGVVHHKGGASVGDARTQTILHSLRSTVLYFRKHSGSAAVGGLRAIALVGAALRSIRSIILLALGVDRIDQRARLRAYARMARWAVSGGEPRP